MGLRSLNNTASSFNDPYASTGLEAYLPFLNSRWNWWIWISFNRLSHISTK